MNLLASNKKTILVVGGAGYIGSHTVKLLVENKFNVIVFDNLSTGHRYALPKDVKFYLGDLKNTSSIKKVFDENKIDCVIHFAALIEAGKSMQDPAPFFRNNVVNTINLLDIMLEHNVKKIIFSSSAAVYGNPIKIPITEDHPKNPSNYYGLTKLMIEQVLESYNHAYQLKFVALRYFNAAGADESAQIGEDHTPETHLIPNIILNAKAGKEVCLFGNNYKTKDGSCIRDYVHVNDLANAHLLAAKKIDKLNAKFINLGTGVGNSVFEIVDLCESTLGIKIKRKILARREGDPAILVADYKLAKKLLGWTPKRNIKEIIETAVRWHLRK